MEKRFKLTTEKPLQLYNNFYLALAIMLQVLATITYFGEVIYFTVIQAFLFINLIYLFVIMKEHHSYFRSKQDKHVCLPFLNYIIVIVVNVFISISIFFIEFAGMMVNLQLALSLSTCILLVANVFYSEISGRASMISILFSASCVILIFFLVLLNPIHIAGNIVNGVIVEIDAISRISSIGIVVVISVIICVPMFYYTGASVKRIFLSRNLGESILLYGISVGWFLFFFYAFPFNRLIMGMICFAGLLSMNILYYVLTLSNPPLMSWILEIILIVLFFV